ncbi:MAG: DUF3426 domain-containing protein [Pseudomonadota bacterium]
MSLITRCPACGTMFKVVADQLKVSQGWVRCGHCSEVFDASLHLQPAQIPTQVPPPPYDPEPQQHSYTGQAQQGYLPSQEPEPFQQTPQPVQTEQLQDDPSWTPGVFFNGQPPVSTSQSYSEATVPDQRHASVQAAPVPDDQPPRQPHHRDGLEADEYGEAVRVMAAEVRDADGDDRSASLYTEDSVRGPLLDESRTSHDVSFVRDAKRKAFWRKPAVRVVLVALSLLLAAALVLQVAIQQRDQIAALQPALKPWLDAVCDQLHCDVGPLRRIETVVIDSSTFNKMDADSYRLSFSLKNTGTTPVAMPHLEVTLTDMQDQAVVRRVLTPAQFGASATMLVAGSDFAGFVVMQVLASDTSAAASATVPLRVAGYRMLAFYP